MEGTYLRMVFLLLRGGEDSMKIPDTFIIIPCEEGYIHYIRPYDIVRLGEKKGYGTAVFYKTGDKAEAIKTSLTAKEIHERMSELEQQTFLFTFGEDNASD